MADVCAVARALPIYSAKSGEKKEVRQVYVTFIYTDGLKTNGESSPSEEDVKCFSAVAQSVRLAAKITDMPCADMNTDNFLDVFLNIGFKFIFLFLMKN